MSTNIANATNISNVANNKVFHLSEQALRTIQKFANTADDAVELAELTNSVPELRDLSPTQIVHDLKDANALFHERGMPLPSAIIPPAPVFPTIVPPKKKASKKDFESVTNEKLDVVYDYLLAGKTFIHVIYMYEKNESVGRGHNAPLIVDKNNIGVNGVDYSDFLSRQKPWRITTVSEMKLNHWVPQFNHYNKIIEMMKKEGKWPFKKEVKNGSKVTTK